MYLFRSLLFIFTSVIGYRGNSSILEILVIIFLCSRQCDGKTVLEFSRFARNEPLENLSLEALIQGFEKITGEAAKDVLTLAGKGDNLEVTRYLVNETIVYANSLANKGQILTTPNKSTTAASGNAAGSSVGDASTSADIAAQKEMRGMRQDLDALKNKSKDMLVDEALQNVRTLASRPKLTSNPRVLLAAIEMLVDSANKADHKDSDMYQKSLSTCRKYEEHPDFCGLVLKLFGSQEDKRISSLVADWAKSKKYAETTSLSESSCKKVKFVPCIPDWELEYGFNPEEVLIRKRGDIFWVNYKGEETTQPSYPRVPPSKEGVANGILIYKIFVLEIQNFSFLEVYLRVLISGRILAVLIREFREELKYWRFLDDWEGFSLRSETHFQIILATDSSLYRWGAFLLCGDSKSEFGDYWNSQDNSPIHVKEANVLLLSLLSVKDKIVNARVDSFCDNLAVVKAWNNEGGRDPSLNSILKQIFELSKSVNLHLRLMYVRSAENPADRESRKLRYIDAQLAPVKWEFVEEKFGPHSVDLMSLDSNAMRGKAGKLLKHFTPFPTVESDGANLFSQDLTLEDNPYVLPPFNLIFSVLKFVILLRLRGVLL
ncbi:unnamed protein product [Mytilus coruscus]|uniref:Uncharacterized protein n=1 Tax=Mytilus coruscus TaxID=42192 RepID=A0A6J8AN44_MYTCO|nr:unnamed protein product [Mytilus coruscus]